MLAGTEDQMGKLGPELQRGSNLWGIGRLLDGAAGAVTFGKPGARVP